MYLMSESFKRFVQKLWTKQVFIFFKWPKFTGGPLAWRGGGGVMVILDDLSDIIYNNIKFITFSLNLLGC